MPFVFLPVRCSCRAFSFLKPSKVILRKWTNMFPLAESHHRRTLVPLPPRAPPPSLPPLPCTPHSPDPTIFCHRPCPSLLRILPHPSPYPAVPRPRALSGSVCIYDCVRLVRDFHLSANGQFACGGAGALILQLVRLTKAVGEGGGR